MKIIICGPLEINGIRLFYYKIEKKKCDFTKRFSCFDIHQLKNIQYGVRHSQVKRCIYSNKRVRELLKIKYDN